MDMKLTECVSLASCTTFRVGGDARYYAEVTDHTALPGLFSFAKEKHLPIFILGGGSNLLVGDKGFPGLVIKMVASEMSWSSDGADHLLSLDAGCVWDEVVHTAVKKNFWGIENLSLIPGTVGGAVVQNIGAYGAEISSVIERVTVFDPLCGAERELSREECRFGYRDSIFKHGGADLVVLRVALRLSPRAKPNILYKDISAFFLPRGGIAPTLADIREAVIHIRRAKLPDIASYGTAGSFFKNPIVKKSAIDRILTKYPLAPHHDLEGGNAKLSAGWIIDQILRMKGHRVGNVGCWKDQALVIVNYGGASATEIKKFIGDIQKKSFEAMGITLEPEVLMIGE